MHSLKRFYCHSHLKFCHRCSPNISQRPSALKVDPGLWLIAGRLPSVGVRGNAVETDLVAPMCEAKGKNQINRNHINEMDLNIREQISENEHKSKLYRVQLTFCLLCWRLGGAFPLWQLQISKSTHER